MNHQPPHLHYGPQQFHATTILSVRRNGRVAVGGDGQVTVGDTVMKDDARKVRRLSGGHAVVGFAGAVADAFALVERLEQKVSTQRSNLLNAAVELARDWRTDRVLRRLEAMLIACDAEHDLLISGSGEVIQPKDGILSIGSGSAYALAAARALAAETDLDAPSLCRRALEIASDICIYSNGNIVIEEIDTTASSNEENT